MRERRLVPAGRVRTVLVVLVAPVGQGVAAFSLAGVATGVRPPVGHGAVEALHLAVGLWSARPRPLRGDRQGLPGVTPQVRSVGASVVRQHLFDGDAVFAEPMDGSVHDDDGGDGGLVIVDLGVRDTGVVVDDGVDERVTELRVAPLALRLPRGRRTIAFSLASADVAPSTAVGDVPELLHVHVRQRAGVGVLVSANRLARGPVDVRQSVEAGRREDSMHGGRGDAEAGRELDRPFPQAHSQADAPLRHRLRGLVRRRPRARRPVVHGLPGPVAVGPPLHRRPRHLEAGGDLTDRPPDDDDETGHLEPVSGCESCVGV